MASVFDRNGNYTAGMDLPKPEPGAGEGATFGDIGRRVGSGFTELGGQGASLTQYLLEQAGMPNAATIARSASQLLHVGGDVLEEGVTPGGQRASGISGYKEAPFSTFAMQVAGVAPTVAIMALVPGGFIGEGLAGGGMLAGQVVDQAIAKTNNLTDAQKQDRIPYYKYLRQDKGLSEDDALANYHRALVPYKDLATASLIGAATMGAGARLLKNGAIIGAGGKLKGAVEAGGEAAIGGGVAAGTADVERQKAESVEKSPTGEAAPTDWNRTMPVTLEGAFNNGVIGLVGGGLHGGKGEEPKTDIPPVEEAPPTAPVTPPAPLTPAVSTDQNMQPPSGLQHELPLQPPAVAPAAPAPGGQQDLFAPPTGPAANEPVEPPPPPPSAEAVPTGPQADLPLKPPAYAPTGQAPEGQGDLFPTHIPPVEDAPPAPAPAPVAPPAPADTSAPPAPPAKTLEQIRAETAAAAPKAPGAVDTSTAATPPPPPPAPKPRKAKPTVQVVPENAPDADQTAALGASGVGKPPDAATPPPGKPTETPPAAEAVPTSPAAPAPAAPPEPPKAPEAKAAGAPDETVTASQPPKGTGTGATVKPPGAASTGDDTKVKPGAKGAASRRGRVPAPPEPVAEVTPEVSAALAPEAAPAPEPTPAPAAAPAAAAQPAPAAAAPPVAQPSLAELLQRQQMERPPEPAPAQPAPAAATPSQPAPAPAAPAPKPLDQILREQQGGAAAAPAPTAADMPTPAAQEVAETGVRSQLPTGERVLEGGPAAPEWEKTVLQKPREEAAAKTDIAAERGDKTSSLKPLKPLSEMSSAEQKNVRRSATIEANAAVKKARETGGKAHPIHEEIAHQAAVLKSMGQGGGMSPKKVAQSARVMAAVDKLRQARQEGGELGPRTKADVNVGGAPRTKPGEVTRGGTPVTETVRTAMDKAAEGLARKKAERETAAAKAKAGDEEIARQRALQDAREKPMTPEVRKHVELAAHDPNRTPNERATAGRMLEVDDDKVARAKEAQNRFMQPAAPEHVPTAKERAAAERQTEPPPHPGASPKEWRDWLSRTMDVETQHIERGSYGSGGAGGEAGIHELGEGDEGFHEGDRPAHEEAVGNVSLVNDPKGFARIAMQMQLQDAREMTRTENQGVLPIRISKRVKPARQLTVDQLEQVRDNKTLPKNLREYASNKIGELLDRKPKKVTTPREPKAAKVTPEIRPERAGAKKDAEGVWRPTVGGVMLERGSSYKTYGDALKAAEREAQHRIRPTRATAAEGVDTARKVRGLEDDRKNLIKDNAARAEEIAAKTKEANGKQSLLDRKALAAEAKAAELSVKDFRAKLSTEIKATRAEVEKTKADIDEAKARIKDLNAYIEHPETQRRRAEEVEEAQERGRKPGTGAPNQGTGGARLTGRKSLEELYKEGEQAGQGKSRAMEMPSGEEPAKGWGSVEGENVTVKTGGKDVSIRVNHSTTLGPELERARSYIHGLTRTGEIADSVLKRVQKLSSDVAVHFVSGSELDKFVKANPHMTDDAIIGGFYDYKTNKIFVRDGVTDPDLLSHIIFHEGLHATTSKVLEANPGFRMQIEALMKEAKAIGMQYGASRYAFTDAHEFLAEAFSNKIFRDKLASFDITPELKKALAIEGWRKKTGFKAQLKNLWDALKYAISDALGVPKASSFLEATLATTERIMKEHERTRPREDLSRPAEKAIVDSADPAKMTGHYMKMPETLHDVGEKLSHLEPGSEGRRLGYKFRTGDQLRQAYEHLFGARDEGNPMRNFVDSIEKASVKGHVYQRDGEALSRRVFDLNSRKPEIAKEFARLAQEATIHNIHLDRANGHLSVDDLGDAQSRAALPRLKAEFEALARKAPETRALWKDAVDYFQNTHDAMARQLIDNHLELIDDAHTAVGGSAGLRQRLFDGKATADDMKLFSKGQADSFAQMREIHRMDGAYFPLMRRGDFAVRATMKVDPGQGALVEPNVVQFTDEKQAHAYAENSPLKVLKTSEVWVDGNQRVSKKDPNAVKAYRIEVQHEHLSFHDKEHEAIKTQAALKADPSVASVKDVMLRQNDPKFDIEMSSPQVQAILRSIDQNHSMSAAKKAEMKRAWVDISHRLVAGNRVETRRIPRRNVLGASLELGRNIDQYSSSTSAYRAKLEFSKPIQDALARMQKEHDDRTYSGDNESTLRRGEVLREMTERLYGGLADMNTKTSAKVQGVSTLAFLRSMASPAHMLIHSTHPWMISMPVLGARHGFGRASGALGQVYKDIGGLGAVKEGMKSFAKSVASGGTSASKNWLDHFSAEFRGKDKADIVKMWNELAETGHIHPEAGMDVHRMSASEGGNILAGIRRVDAMVREMTSTSEAINRFAESAAAYRLERLKGASHEAAVRYAKDTLANTQGLYSRTNVPTVFRNKWTRPFLQFKQFPQMIYNLLAKSAYQAFKGETLEIRKEARRQFAGVVATHAFMAGALGLPTEPIRAVMMLGNAMGLPGMDWNEHVDQLTKLLADKYGPQAAEIIMHGFTRAWGSASVDLHHRAGLGTPLLGLDPRSNSETDIKSYLFDMIGGAFLGQLWDMGVKGPKLLLTGDTAKGLETILPFKGLTDPIRAAAGYLGGKKTARGNQIAPPLNAVQTFMQGIGFVPAAVSQANAATASVKQTQIREGRERQSIINASIGGRPDGAAIARWNNQHPDRKISYSTLTTARREAKLPQALGQKVNKGNRALIDATSRAYNLGGVQ